MMTLAPVAFLCGLLLARRFGILILLPALLLAALASAVHGFAAANQLPEIVLQTVVITGSLQIGYVLGSLWMPRPSRQKCVGIAAGLWARVHRVQS